MLQHCLISIFKDFLRYFDSFQTVVVWTRCPFVLDHPIVNSIPVSVEYSSILDRASCQTRRRFSFFMRTTYCISCSLRDLRPRHHDRLLTHKHNTISCRNFITRMLFRDSYWYYCFSHTIITALHVMQTRYCDENSVCPSVRLSVCLSVTCVYCDKTVERSVQIYIPYERTFSLVFREEEWLVEGDPFYLKFWVNRPPFERNRRFSTNNRS